MENLLKILDEQNTIEFNGRVNILAKENKKFLGEVLFSDGNIIYSKFIDKIGIRSLIHMVLMDIEHSDFVIVVEPELINSKTRNIVYGYEYIKKTIQKNYEDYLKYKDLKPSDDLFIYIKSDFIKNHNVKITIEEFDLICLIYEFNKVKDLYSENQFIEYEITKNLVSLRKKNALRITN